MRVDAFSSLRIPNLVGDGRSSKLNRSLNFTVVPAPCHRKSRRWVLGCPWPIGYATPGRYCVSRGFLRQRGLIMGCSTTLSPLSADPFAYRSQPNLVSCLGAALRQWQASLGCGPGCQTDRKSPSQSRDSGLTILVSRRYSKPVDGSVYSVFPLGSRPWKFFKLRSA